MRSDCHYSAFRVDVTEWGLCWDTPPAHHGARGGPRLLPGTGFQQQSAAETWPLQILLRTFDCPSSSTEGLQ